MSEPKPQLPVHAQISIVNAMVLPLLDKMGINVTVTNSLKGMRLDIAFKEPDAPVEEPVIGTETPDNAAQLWALRDKIEQYRRDHPELDAE